MIQLQYLEASSRGNNRKKHTLNYLKAVKRHFGLYCPSKNTMKTQYGNFYGIVNKNCVNFGDVKKKMSNLNYILVFT
jgi:hypothetical protein